MTRQSALHQGHCRTTRKVLEAGDLEQFAALMNEALGNTRSAISPAMSSGRINRSLTTWRSERGPWAEADRRRRRRLLLFYATDKSRCAMPCATNRHGGARSVFDFEGTKLMIEH